MRRLPSSDAAQPGWKPSCALAEAKPGLPPLPTLPALSLLPWLAQSRCPLYGFYNGSFSITLIILPGLAQGVTAGMKASKIWAREKLQLEPTREWIILSLDTAQVSWKQGEHLKSLLAIYQLLSFYFLLNIWVPKPTKVRLCAFMQLKGRKVCVTKLLCNSFPKSTEILLPWITIKMSKRNLSGLDNIKMYPFCNFFFFPLS